MLGHDLRKVNLMATRGIIIG